MKIKALWIAVLIGGWAASAWATTNIDEGLYDPLPPEGSAFVRFMNVSPGDGSEEAKARGKAFDYLDYKETSPYFAMPEGSIDASIGPMKKTFNAQAGSFYTLALDSGQIRLFEDDQNNNRAKAQIIFYNFGQNDSLSLKTNDGKVEIIPAVASDGTGIRQINPVKVPLAVYAGDQMVKDLGPFSLERSQSYSVIIYPNKDAELIKGTTNTTR